MPGEPGVLLLDHMNIFTSSLAAFAGLFAAMAPAAAHVSLAQPLAQIGSSYQAVLGLGHGCDKASTTSITVQIPAGFAGARPLAKPGWNLSTQGAAVTWTASNKEAAIPTGERGEFTLAGTLPASAGPLWFKVLQGCGQATLDWAQVPAEGISTAGLTSPAGLLQVMSARDLAQAQALPKVEGAWVRSSVPGQQGTGGFMKLTAREPMQLVGVSTPVAGTAEVHEMKMEGDVMRMRAVPKLDLPAGQAVELRPGGYHLMLLDLKQPLAVGTTVPLTLLLRDAKGKESKLELKVPVSTQAPGRPAGAPTDGHKH